MSLFKEIIYKINIIRQMKDKLHKIIDIRIGLVWPDSELILSHEERLNRLEVRANAISEITGKAMEESVKEHYRSLLKEEKKNETT